MMLNNILSSGALPSLEMSIRFASQRNELIGHNIANISMPNFQQKDVSPESFQNWLSKAVDERRQRTGGMHGELHAERDRQFVQRKDGGIDLNPLASTGGVLAHDRNNRDIEQLMQDLSENLSAYQVATDLMRSQMGTLRVAITERT